MIKSPRVIRECPKSNDKYLYKRHTEKRHTKVKGNVKKGVEIGVMGPQQRKEMLTATRRG